MWPHLVLTVLFKPRLGVNSRWFHTRALFPFTALKAPASSILSESRTKLGPGRDERQIQHDGISQGNGVPKPFRATLSSFQASQSAFTAAERPRKKFEQNRPDRLHVWEPWVFAFYGPPGGQSTSREPLHCQLSSLQSNKSCCTWARDSPWPCRMDKASETSPFLNLLWPPRL